MKFLSFLPFLIAVFSASNAALLPLNLDDSDLSSTSFPLPDLPPLGSLPLKLPAPSNDPISFDPNLNAIAIASDSNPTSSYTPGLAQEPSGNGAGDGVAPSTPYAETQTHIDDSNQICIPESSTGQNRRKRQANVDVCPKPAMLEFYPNVPQKAQASDTKLPEENTETDEMARRDNTWLGNKLKKIFLSNREQKTRSELDNELARLSNDESDSCFKRPVPSGSYARPNSFCCLGPSQMMTLPSTGLRLARRQSSVTITNWYNCQPRITGRPFCLFYLNSDWHSNVICCRGWSADAAADPLSIEVANWWRWGVKGLDCVKRFVVNPG